MDPSTLGYDPCVEASTCGSDVVTEADEGVDSVAHDVGDVTPAGGQIGAFSGRWVLIETQAVTTVDMPFVGQLDTTSVHHYLVDVSVEGNALVLSEDLCELEIFEQTCHNVGITVIPQVYVEAIEPLERRVVLASGAVGDGFVSNRVTALRGAQLEDPVNDPMPTFEDPTGAIDQDSDGHPGMTVLLNGVFAGSEVYTAQRWWSEFRGTIESPNRVEGLLLHGNETNTLGADPPGLAYQTANAPNDDATRSFFRLLRVSDNYTCAQLVHAAYGGVPCPVPTAEVPECTMRGFHHLDGSPNECPQ